MPSYDDRTLRGWPLPFRSNTLEFDVERLRETFTAIDEALSAFEEGTRTLLNEQVAGLEEKQYILDARMDVIAGQTTEDSEILDARVDAKGVTHPNVGHNVRTLHSEVIELDESVKYGINEFRGLMRQFNELAYAQIQSELNTREAHERRKAELAHETQARIEADEELHEGIVQETLTREEQTDSLQTQTQELSEASIQQSVNLHREAEQRRSDIQETKSLIKSESEERIREDTEIRTHTAQSLSKVNKALNDEIASRKHADDELHADIQILQSQDEALQAQADDLALASLNNALNFRDTAERGREALKQEALNRTQDDEFQQEQIDSLAQADIQQSFNLHEEAEQRRKVAEALTSETTAREENDEALRQKISAVNEALNLEKSERLKTNDDLQRRLGYEEYARHSDDTAQQEQIDDLAKASLHHSLNLHKEKVAREKDKAVQAEINTHLQSEIDSLTASALMDAINLSNEADSRRTADKEEIKARKIQGELLQTQIDDLSNASIRQNLNAKHEAEIRRESFAQVNTQLDTLQKQTAYHQIAISDLLEAMLKVALNIHEALERRREALTREGYTRAENDDLLQTQIDDLTAGAIQAAKNLHEALERRREALNQETQARIEHDDILQDEITDNTKAILQQSVNIAREAEKRRELEKSVISDITSALKTEAEAREAADNWEAELRASETSALQIQVNDLAKVSLGDRFSLLAIKLRHKDDIQQETHQRSESDSYLQEQINELAFAVIKVALNDKEARERLREFVDRLYQAVADTGNLTYMGAGIASTNEIRNMLDDVLSGNESETTASDIPEELQDNCRRVYRLRDVHEELSKSKGVNHSSIRSRPHFEAQGVFSECGNEWTCIRRSMV